MPGSQSFHFIHYLELPAVLNYTAMCLTGKLDTLCGAYSPSAIQGTPEAQLHAKKSV